MTFAAGRARAVALAALCLVAPLLAGCQDAEVTLLGLEDVLLNEPWAAGAVQVEGVILSVEHLQGARGPMTLLTLELPEGGAVAKSMPPPVLTTGPIPKAPEGGPVVALFVNATRTYAVGATYTGQATFQAVQVAGRASVAMAELDAITGIPQILARGARLETQRVLADFVYQAEDADGWVTYRIQTARDTTTPYLDLAAIVMVAPSAQNGTDSLASWGKYWSRASANLTAITATTDGAWNAAERHANLQAIVNATVPSAYIRINDTDGDLALSDGDMVAFHNVRAGNDYGIAALVLRDVRADERILKIVQPFGPDGLLYRANEGDWMVQTTRAKGEDGQWSQIVIANTVGTAVPVANATLSITIGEGKANTTTLRVGSGLVGAFGFQVHDRNLNAILDDGDIVALDGLPAAKAVSARLGTNLAGTIRTGAQHDWIPGTNTDVADAGNFTLKAGATPATAKVAMAKDYRAYEDLNAVTVSVRASNGTLLMRAPLIVGEIGNWTGGEVIYSDLGAPGFNNGDTLLLNADDAGRFTIEVSVLGGFRKPTFELRV